MLLRCNCRLLHLRSNVVLSWLMASKLARCLSTRSLTSDHTSNIVVNSILLSLEHWLNQRRVLLAVHILLPITRLLLHLSRLKLLRLSLTTYLLGLLKG